MESCFGARFGAADVVLGAWFALTCFACTSSSYGPLFGDSPGVAGSSATTGGSGGGSPVDASTGNTHASSVDTGATGGRGSEAGGGSEPGGPRAPDAAPRAHRPSSREPGTGKNC